SARDDLRDAMQKAVEGYRLRIRQCGMTLENCNPQNILDRGYSMVCDAKTGRVIRSAEETEKGAELTIRPARGLISATVN
ncbi:MAG: exodeoxyribonuclease VII large subunit, partial [Treponema sp.]|nr:exodeoxyribonuclease VII large subunit [Treponema sp.]